MKVDPPRANVLSSILTGTKWAGGYNALAHKTIYRTYALPRNGVDLLERS